MRWRRVQPVVLRTFWAVTGALIALAVVAAGRATVGRSAASLAPQTPQATAGTSQPATPPDARASRSEPEDAADVAQEPQSRFFQSSFPRQPRPKLNPASPPTECTGGIQLCPENPGHGWVWYCAGDEDRPSWHLEKLPEGYRPRDPYAGMPFSATPEGQRQARQQEEKAAREQKILEDVQRRFREAMPPEEPEETHPSFGFGR